MAKIILKEIRELMALQQAADEYKDNGAPSTKPLAKKVEEEEDDPEAEVVVSGTDFIKDTLIKRLSIKPAVPELI